MIQTKQLDQKTLNHIERQDYFKTYNNLHPHKEHNLNMYLIFDGDKYKIGETQGKGQSVEQRVKYGYSKTTNKVITALLFWSRYNKKGELFSDKDVHKLLIKKYSGRPDYKKNGEWFGGISPEEMLETVNELYGEKVYQKLTLRPDQLYVYNEMKRHLTQGQKYLLLSVAVRTGKTTIVLSIAKDLNLHPVFISKVLTSNSSALSDNEEFGLVETLSDISLHGNSGDEIKVESNIEKINSDNKFNKDLMFITDEVDEASHTPTSVSRLSKTINHYEEQGKVGAVVTMSGTEAHKGNSLFDSLGVDPEPILLDYHEKEELAPKTTVRREYKCISRYVSEGGLLNISQSLSNTQKSIRDFGSYLMTVLKRDNDYGIKHIENEDGSLKFPHVYILLGINSTSTLTSFVSTLNKFFKKDELDEYVFVPVFSGTTSNKKAQEDHKLLITQNPGKRIVFISMGIGSKSYSIKEIGTAMFISDGELSPRGIQGMSRSLTHVTGKHFANMIFLTTNNSNEIRYDNIALVESAKYDENQRPAVLKEILRNTSSFHFTDDGERLKKVNVSDFDPKTFIDQSLQSSVRVNLMVDYAINNLPEEFKEEFARILSLYSNGKSSKPSVKAKGNDEVLEPKRSEEKEPKEVKEKSAKNKIKEEQKRAKELFEEMEAIPVMLRLTKTNVNTFSFSGFVMNKEIYEFLYKIFKTKLDRIYNLCEDDEYLNEKYFDKVLKYAENAAML